MNVYYLGPEGSFSHALVMRAFAGDFFELRAQASFGAVSARILSEEDSIGVYPIENSVTSNIHENIDLLFRTDLRIIGEGQLRIKLHLVGLKEALLSDIREVHSNSKALAQCSRYLDELGVKRVETNSTSAGRDVVLARDDKAVAALGRAALGEHERLQVLASDITDVKNHITRFVFVSQTSECADDSENNKMTLTFKLKHESGSLAKVLTEFSNQGINLTKISSRPIPGSNFEYNFWVDLEFEPGDSERVIETVKMNTLEYRVVGIYKSGQTYDD